MQQSNLYFGIFSRKIPSTTMPFLAPYQLLILFSFVSLFEAQITTNTSEPFKTSANNTTTDIDSKDDYNTSNSREMPDEKPYDVELSSLNKYRRNGLNIDFPDRWEEDRKRYMDYSERNRFEDDPYQYQKERFRVTGKSYPVRIQGCNQYSRDVSRDDEVTRSGILQGWLGAAQSGRNNEKNLDMSPFYVTTATAKTVPSYRNRDKNYGDYENYEKPNVIGKSKPSNNYRVKGSASRDVFNFQNDYMDDRTTSSWRSPQQKNNRVVYYEYNLDDNRRPDSAYYGEDNFRTNYNQPCESDYEENARIPSKNQYDRGRYKTQTFSNFVPQSKLSTSFNQGPGERPYSNYYADDYHQPRNLERNENDGRVQGGYEFNVPFSGTPNGMHFPGISPNYIPQAQFSHDSSNDRQDKGDVKHIPFRENRFQFQTN